MKYIFYLLLTIQSVWGQKLLDKPITIKITNERTEVALKKISELGGFNFSYNSNIIDLDRRVSINANKQTLKQVLDEIFKGSVSYKESNGYVIFQKRDAPKEVFINGLVFDEETGERIAQASVFERRTLASAVTNINGYYRIKLPANNASTKLDIRKENYWGEAVTIGQRTKIDVGLQPKKTDKPQPLITPVSPVAKDTTVQDSVSLAQKSEPKQIPDTLTIPPIDTIAAQEEPKRVARNNWKKAQKTIIDAFASVKQDIHTDNISDTLYRPIQLSLLPFIGTNHALSGNVINTLSYNIVAGYSLGVDGLEIGNVLNLVRGDVNGVQVSGVANLVGRDVSGWQMAGVFNTNLRNLRGVQMAGTLNTSVGQVNGWQLAGVANVAVRDLRGAQLSGVLNVTAGRLYGWQLAPYNYATRVLRGGRQLGVVNYADSSATVPYGFLSIVRKNGYRRLELSTDELHYACLMAKTGMKRFYNIFSVGLAASTGQEPLLSLGYGIGTAFDWGRGWGLNIDYVQNNFFDTDLNPYRSYHTRLSMSLEKKIFPHLAIAIGPTLNTNIVAQNEILVLNNTRLWSKSRLNQNVGGQSWIGLQVGLRVCNKTTTKFFGRKQ